MHKPACCSMMTAEEAAELLLPSSSDDMLDGFSTEQWASAVHEATQLPQFRDSTQAAEVAASRWLKNDEVHDLLTNGVSRYGFALQTSLPRTPGSGSLLFYSKQTCKNFRTDGHQWRTKKNGKSLQETHEKLKVHGKYQLVAYYSTNAEGTLQRRVYSLIEDKERVLVHYRTPSSQTVPQCDAAPLALLPHAPALAPATAPASSSGVLKMEETPLLEKLAELKPLWPPAAPAALADHAVAAQLHQQHHPCAEASVSVSSGARA